MSDETKTGVNQILAGSPHWGRGLLGGAICRSFSNVSLASATRLTRPVFSGAKLCQSLSPQTVHASVFSSYEAWKHRSARSAPWSVILLRGLDGVKVGASPG